MESRLSPLATVAAISVTVFSAVGVAALTGLIPASKGQNQELELPKEALMPIEPAIAHPVNPAPAASKPKPLARPAAPRKIEPVVFREFDEAPRAREIPQPVARAGTLGTVESVREVTRPGETKGIGAAAGVGVGAVLGNKIGESAGNKGLLTILGGVGGALAGNAIEKHQRQTKHWELTVRFEDGTSKTLTSEVEPTWHSGYRVRMVEGKLQPV